MTDKHPGQQIDITVYDDPQNITDDKLRKVLEAWEEHRKHMDEHADLAIHVHVPRWPWYKRLWWRIRHWWRALWTR